MIFYDGKLMGGMGGARLFMAENPTPFEDYEDHEAAIHLRLVELARQAVAEGEDPAALAEDYLGVPYNEAPGIDGAADFIMRSGAMAAALQNLRENWQAHGGQPEAWEDGEGIASGGPGRGTAAQAYLETTLRGYLETLSTYDG